LCVLCRERERVSLRRWIGAMIEIDPNDMLDQGTLEAESREHGGISWPATVVEVERAC
jgi:hypothetical protein